MAHTRKRSNGRWQARIRVDGREVAKDFTKKVDADRWLHEMESMKNRGQWVDPSASRVRLSVLADRWFQQVHPSLKAKTAVTYESLIRSRLLPTFGSQIVSTLQASDVIEWINVMRAEGLSPSRIRQAHVVLSSMLQSMVEDGCLGRNVARYKAVRARLPDLPKREAEYLAPAEVDALIKAAPEKYRALIAVMGVLGLRFGEAAALRRDDVNLLRRLRRRLIVDESLAEIGGNMIFGLPKTHATREVPLPPSLVALLAHHIESVGASTDALLFTSSRGYPLRYSRFRPTVWLPLLEQAGIPRTRVHTLRHSAAARMIGSGWGLTAVSKTLGHESPVVTGKVYAHVMPDHFDALADRLDQPLSAVRNIR